MPDILNEEIMKYLERATDTLNFIPEYISIGDYNTAINRSYYAAFYAIKACEILEGFDSKKHSGLINHFRLTYIKTGIFDESYSVIIQSLFDMRSQSDYDINCDVNKGLADECFENAAKLINVISEYLSQQL